MNRALKLSEGKFLNMDQIVEWEVCDESIKILLGVSYVHIAVSDLYLKEDVKRIHTQLSEYMGAPIDSLKVYPDVGQPLEQGLDSGIDSELTPDTDNTSSSQVINQTQEISLSLTQMDQNWQPCPNGEVSKFLVSHDIPAQFADEQLLEFKEYYITNGKAAMFWDARFINWIQRALYKAVN